MRRSSQGSSRARLAVLVMLSLCSAACRGRQAEVAPQADALTRRATQTGEVIGFRDQYGSDAWYGIPFAKPPVAELRWRAPQPPQPWTGVRPALSHGAMCSQYAGSLAGGASGKPGEPSGSEDCLYLNIWAPRGADGKAPSGLPVMVWIHGGGNTVGHGGFYEGGNLATTGDVVVVSINYRLGPFGWFRHPALDDAGASPLDRSGNYGTLDIVRSLEWVRDNIASFGGDPNNVTIFGESAGGSDVYTMLLAPQARGLFHRAMVESGGLGFETVAKAENFVEDGGDKNSSSELLLRLLIADGKAKDRAGAKQVAAGMSREDIAVYLRGQSNTAILRGYHARPGFGMIEMPKVFTDGVVLPTADPLQLFARGAEGYNAVPVLVGTNRDENKLFLFGDPKNVRRLFWIAPRLRDERMYNLTAEYLAKMWKASGADEPAAAMRVAQDKVFVYRFDWDEEPHLLGADLSVMLGASHGFEIPFVFGHFDLGREGNVIFTEENDPGRRQLSREMISYWSQFAHAGAPGKGRKQELPEWNAGPAFMVLDTPAGGGLRLSSDTVTSKGVVAAVATDPRLKTAEDRCRILGSLVSWSRGYSREEYAAVEECRPYPLEGDA